MVQLLHHPEELEGDCGWALKKIAARRFFGGCGGNTHDKQNKDISNSYPSTLDFC